MGSKEKGHGLLTVRIVRTLSKPEQQGLRASVLFLGLQKGLVPVMAYCED